MKGRVYLCIDLKSFYASVECVARGLDPFRTNLVVADATRGQGSICLAITPAMKALGVRNRCRVYEIPKNIEYITAMPQMRKYMQVSAQVYSVYLRYISEEDIHVYSVDECFLDVTDYLRLYGKKPREMAQLLMDEVFRETGICATAGIGTNLFLAKVALDILAKHAPDHIGFLDEDTFKEEIWYHRPVTDIWNVGGGTARRLERMGVYDLHGITLLDEKLLFREFGVNARYLIDHAHGVEPCTIADIRNHEVSEHSISHSQILFEDYNFDDTFIILREMVDLKVLELREKHLVAGGIGLSIGYSDDALKPSGASRKLECYTASFKKLMPCFEELYRECTSRNIPIRRVSISFNLLRGEEEETVNLFTDKEAAEKEKKLQRAMLDVRNRYGRNAILKGTSYREKATGRARNKMVGGHNG